LSLEDVAMTIRVRDLRPNDIPQLHSFIDQLCRHEHLEAEFAATEDDYRVAFFENRSPKVFALIAEVDGVPAGCAVYSYNFSTSLGKHGMFLEDLYVAAEFRAQGVGTCLIGSMLRSARERGLGRLEWRSNKANLEAHRFYKGLRAKSMDQWEFYRLMVKDAGCDDRLERGIASR
jgi:GNAT superfamily N-acetyltransferase